MQLKGSRATARAKDDPTPRDDSQFLDLFDAKMKRDFDGVQGRRRPPYMTCQACRDGSHRPFGRQLHKAVIADDLPGRPLTGM
jgi:hypothetical protein